jgi:hypothetical protein
LRDLEGALLLQTDGCHEADGQLQNGKDHVPCSSCIYSLHFWAVATQEMLEHQEGRCSICQVGVEVHTKIVQLPCKHWYDRSCAIEWLFEHNVFDQGRPPKSIVVSSSGRRPHQRNTVVRYGTTLGQVDTTNPAMEPWKANTETPGPTMSRMLSTKSCILTAILWQHHSVFQTVWRHTDSSYGFLLVDPLLAEMVGSLAGS